MITSLSIQNYALIEQLTIAFEDDLSTITGETGAGKSILLGALGLALGNRADLTSLKNTDKKCIIEVQFAIEKYCLQDFFEQIDLDYASQTIIRREILPSGKSRAFVNDTPVRLSVLNELKAKLIDIHSQHQTMQLSDTDFQFSIVDTLAKNDKKIASYKRGLQKYRELQKAFSVLVEQQRQSKEKYDYNLHLFSELETANLQEGEQEIIEKKLSKLNHIETIKQNLFEALQISVNEDIGLQTLCGSLEKNIRQIASLSEEYENLSNRITSLKIELDDIVSVLENENESVDFNPDEITELNDRLQLIYDLQKKHSANSIKELLTVQRELSEAVYRVENSAEIINQKEKELNQVTQKLDDLATMISQSRIKIIPKLQKELELLLSELAMTNARFSIKINPSANYFSNGKDQLEFLFSANKGGNFGELKKVASGGELSRIMLAIKKIISENKQLPTIIFDEIDTGVSGEVSKKIATIMQQMSTNMQVITITHLPQIAARGQQHYKVFKTEVNGVTVTNLKKLTENERVAEIAEMLGGKNYSDTAIRHAKELLN